MSAVKTCPTCGTEYPASERFCPRDGAALRSADAQADLVGQIVAERYHVLRKLGEGGMGQVYLAEHVRMGRQSAVKVMSPGLARDPDAVSRFNREAANASRITHPNVAAIYDFGETSDGLIYLAMEFVEGEPLTALIKSLGSLPIARAVDIARQTADALTVAHELGIVHRDLKPDNIMIARGREGADVVKVVDFGIAKANGGDSQKVTRTGMVVGTPEYMSPEQLAGDKLDGRSDIYSLGLVTFVMLTGKLPFPSDTAQEAMLMRLMEKPKTLAEMRPDVAWTPQLQAVMDKVLARDQAQRYGIAAEFGADLVRVAQGIGTPPRASASPLKTVAMAAPPTVPATRVVATTEAPSVPRPKAAPSRAGLFVGIAAAVVIAAGGTAAVLTRGHAAVVPPPAHADSGAVAIKPPPSQPPPAPVDTVVPVSNTDRRDAHTSPRRTPAPGPSVPSTNPAGDVGASLHRLHSLIDDNQATDALALVDSLYPRLTTNAQRADALFYKAQALGQEKKQDEACAVLREDSSLYAPGTGMREPVNAYLKACQ